MKNQQARQVIFFIGGKSFIKKNMKRENNFQLMESLEVLRDLMDKTKH